MRADDDSGMLSERRFVKAYRFTGDDIEHSISVRTQESI